MSDPSVDEFEVESPLGGRVRPGLQGIGAKCAFVLVSVGLLPLLAVFLISLPQMRGAASAHGQLAQRVADLHEHADALSKRIHEHERHNRDLAHQLELAQLDARRRRALDKTVDRLAPVLEGRTLDELGKEPKLAELLQAGLDCFTDAALLFAASKTVVRSRSGKTGALAAALPELADQWAPEPPAAEPAAGWTWRPVGSTGYWLVAKGAPPPGPAQVERPAAALPDPAGALDELGERIHRLSVTGWALFAGLSLFALSLSLIALRWLRIRILSPIQHLSAEANAILTDPRSASEQDASAAGLLQDLAVSLARHRQRAQRLDAQERAAERHREHLLRIQTAVERAAAGQMGLRAPLEPGDGEELALAINRFLDAVVERVEALRRVAGQLKESAERLNPLAEQLVARAVQDNRAAIPDDPSALVQLLTVHLEGLCKSAGRVTEAFEQTAPQPLIDGDLQDQKAALAATGAGFGLFAERVAEAGGIAEHMAALHQQAEMLSTNLAIGAESKSPKRMERLADDARSMSRAANELAENLTGTLNQLTNSGEQVRVSYQRSAELHQLATAQLQQWERLRQTVLRLSVEVSGRIETVRPAAAHLASDVSRLATALDDAHRLEQQVAQTLLATARGAKSLAGASAELLLLLEGLDTGKPAPAAVTQRLAEQHRALEQALSELSDLAAAEGIDALSKETKQILQSIHTMAESARKRILSEPKGPAASDEPTQVGAQDRGAHEERGGS